MTTEAPEMTDQAEAPARLDEAACRLPSFAEGSVPVTLADAQTWYLPPVDRGPIIPIVEGGKLVAIGLEAGLAGLDEAIVGLDKIGRRLADYAEAVEAGRPAEAVTQGEQAGALFTVALILLTTNYRVPDDQWRFLLPINFETREHDAMWQAITRHARGQAEPEPAAEG